MAAGSESQTLAYSTQFNLLRRKFVEGLPQRLAEIEAAESESARYVSLHKLAGAAGAFGYDALGQIARKAMDTCQASTADTSTQQAALSELRAALKALETTG